MLKAPHPGSESSPTHEEAFDPPHESSPLIGSNPDTQNQGDNQKIKKGEVSTAIGPGRKMQNQGEAQKTKERVIANPIEDTSPSVRAFWDVALLGGILSLTIWPWAFFCVVSAKNGLPMPDRLVEIVSRYPQRVGTVVTSIGTLNRLAASFFFGQTIVRLGQELIDRRRLKDNEGGEDPQQNASHRGNMTVFRILALSAFRHLAPVWEVGTWYRLGLAKERKKLMVLVLLLATWGTVQLVPAGTAGLITPGQVIRNAEVHGMEWDFTSSDPGCLTWMEANRVNNTCGWTTFGNTPFTTCLAETQILNVLDSGRANMLFPGAGVHNQMSSLNQLGVDGGGIRFLGSTKGVLPLGPKGVIPAFNLQSSSEPLAVYDTRRPMLSYNYTLNHQGLNANISCSYDTTSPITYASIEGITTDRVLSSSGTCDAAAGLQDVLEDVVDYFTLNVNNTLTYWACKQIPQLGTLDPTYFVYLRGRTNYRTTIGNITCRISPMRAQDYSVRYESLLGYFVSQSTTDPEQPPLRSTFHRFVEWGLVGLGNIVWETQNWSSNLFAEAVFSAAAKNLNITTIKKHDEYLPLYEALIEGVLHYQATHSRLIYALGSNPPQNCLRSVTGPVSYSVTGWAIEDSFTQALFLLPMTLVNLASLFLLLTCFFIGKLKYSHSFDMTDTLAHLTATVEGEEKPSEEKEKPGKEKEKPGKEKEKPGKEGEIAWSDRVTFPQASNS